MSHAITDEASPAPKQTRTRLKDRELDGATKDAMLRHYLTLDDADLAAVKASLLLRVEAVAAVGKLRAG